MNDILKELGLENLGRPRPQMHLDPDVVARIRELLRIEDPAAFERLLSFGLPVSVVEIRERLESSKRVDSRRHRKAYRAKVAAAAEKLIDALSADFDELYLLTSQPFQRGDGMAGEPLDRDVVLASLRGVRILQLLASAELEPVQRGKPPQEARKWTVELADDLFERYRRQVPTKTEDNDFEQLASYLWELATGEINKSFRHHIRTFVPYSRRPVGRGREMLSEKSDQPP